MSVTIWQFLQVFVGGTVAYYLLLAVYRLFYHPLSGFPGPKLAAITDLYAAYYTILLNGSLVQQLEVLHKIYGSVVRIGPEQLHFNDPHAFEEIYATGSKFTKDPCFYNAFNESESSFGCIDIKKAKQRKDIMRPLFSRRAILELENVIQTTVDKLVSMLSRSISTGKPVNLHLGYLSTSMEIITSYCFAQSYDALSAPDFRHPTLIALESTGTIFSVMQYFPFLTPFIQRMPKWLARVISPESLAYGGLVNGLSLQIDGLLKNPALLEKAEHEIIYHHLLAPRPGKDGQGMISKKSLMEEATVLVGAGTETVGNTCSLGTFYVLNNPAIYTRLVNELREFWPDVESIVGYESLEKLPYLTAVIKESLRMSHGTVSPLPRVVPMPTIIAGMQIPANTTVSMGVTFMHNNPDVFKDPLTFRPDRWLNHDRAREIESFLVPFSKGPRSCLGINLAWAELYLIFANVFRKLEMDIYDTVIDDFKFRALLTPKYLGHFHAIVKKKSI